MKYELTHTNFSSETIISDTEYSINITLGLHPTDDFIPNFSKDITVISDNSKTGFEVDIQRQQAIDDFIALINLETSVVPPDPGI